MLISAIRRRLFESTKHRGGRSEARRPATARTPLVEAMEPRQLLASLMMVNDPNMVEGTGVARYMAFSVGLNVPETRTVTVGYQTANYRAIAGVDYTAVSGTLTFAPGQTSRTVLVPVTPDAVYETNEPFFLKLSGVTNATLLKANGVGTIRDDDAVPVPKLSIDNPRIIEGNSGTKQLAFTLRLNMQVWDKVVSVRLTTRNGSAIAGTDYQARTELVTFARGETMRQFLVTIQGDTVVEGNESLFVALTENNVAVATTSAIGIILNDDV